MILSKTLIIISMFILSIGYSSIYNNENQNTINQIHNNSNQTQVTSVLDFNEINEIFKKIPDTIEFKDEIFNNKENLLSEMINLQDWTDKVITLNGGYYLISTESREILTEKLQTYYLPDTAEKLVGKYYKKEENNVYSFLEQESVGFLKVIEKEQTIKVKKEYENIIVTITGATNDDFYVFAEYTFVKKENKYYIYETKNYIK